MIRFNPRARDGREKVTAAQATAKDVSIHAPVMDANILAEIQAIDANVSIHAPVMDANAEGVRMTRTPSVSIHAPVMDAKLTVSNLIATTGFNPRARDGREEYYYHLYTWIVFQSTRP